MLPLIDTLLVQAALWLLLVLAMFYLGLCIWQILVRQFNQQKSLVDRINRLLPQTQCGQCGQAGCRPYARAIAHGEAINKCPPGGNETIVRLANLLNESLEPLDHAHGKLQPFAVAVIREDECIGCTKCIVACPVDAIIGGAKLMHSVIEVECTGCDLCLDPCPVDCIDMVVKAEQAGGGWQLPGSVNTPVTMLESAT
jgi:electron transport complex protein RnfB